MDVGLRIKATRKAAGMSMYELAKRTGISRGYMHSVEQGGNNPSSEVVFKVAEVLGVSPNYLMDFTADQEQQELNDLELRVVQALRNRNYAYVLHAVAELMEFQQQNS